MAFPPYQIIEYSKTQGNYSTKNSKNQGNYAGEISKNQGNKAAKNSKTQGIHGPHCCL
jgi:hypothetical protein